MIIILTSNDVNLNPWSECSSTGETVYPCSTCNQPVTWHKVVFYATITTITPYQLLVYANEVILINDPAIALGCIMCNCPNYIISAILRYSAL